MRAILATGAILIVLGIGGCVAGKALYVSQQANRVFEKTLDADNMIYNYEWFKRQVQDVAAMDTKIAAAQSTLDGFTAAAGPRENWTFEDKQESARLSTILLGLQGQRASMVAEYNAKTQMANRDLFRTGDLPETLN